MKIGDIVTITVNHPDGVYGCSVKNETGVITDFDKEGAAWVISTGMPGTSGWWYGEDEFRLATDDEIKARLKLILMR